MPRPTAILHVDLDAFFASVEILKSPELRGKPVVVGGDGRRGVVASCSYEARWYGVRSAMPSMRAKRLCPGIVFVPGNYSLYQEYSRRMHEVFESFTPLVEGISLDEAFLDVRGAQRLFGDPVEIAHSIRNRLKADLGLSASVGVASTKHVAKLASVAAKPRASRKGPVEGAGVFCVPDESAIDFLHPLPVRALWGVGPKTAAKLDKLGIDTVRRLAEMPLANLETLLGPAVARHLHDLAWNCDDRSVEPVVAAKSIGHEQTYADDLVRRADVHLQLVRLSDATAARLRSAGKAGRTLTVKVRFSDFETITRSRTVSAATANATNLVHLAEELTSDIDLARGIRLLGVSLSNLEDAISVEQLEMSPADGKDDALLDEVIDRIRDRYGHEAVVPAPLVGSAGQGILRKGAGSR